MSGMFTAWEHTEEVRWKNIYKWVTVVLAVFLFLGFSFGMSMLQVLAQKESSQNTRIQVLTAQLDDATEKINSQEAQIASLQERLDLSAMSQVRFMDKDLRLHFESQGLIVAEGGYWIDRLPVFTDRATGRRYTLDVFQGETITLRADGNTLYYDTCLTGKGIRSDSCRVLNGVLIEDFDPNWVPSN